MNLPHDLRFLSHIFFGRAIKRFGFQDQLLKTNAAAARLQLATSTILIGDRTKAKEVELINAVAEMEVYLSQIVTAIEAQGECRSAIKAKLDELLDDVMRKGG